MKKRASKSQEHYASGSEKGSVMAGMSLAQRLERGLRDSDPERRSS